MKSLTIQNVVLKIVFHERTIADIETNFSFLEHVEFSRKIYTKIEHYRAKKNVDLFYIRFKKNK